MGSVPWMAVAPCASGRSPCRPLALRQPTRLLRAGRESLSRPRGSPGNLRSCRPVAFPRVTSRESQPWQIIPVPAPRTARSAPSNRSEPLVVALPWVVSASCGSSTPLGRAPHRSSSTLRATMKRPVPAPQVGAPRGEVRPPRAGQLCHSCGTHQQWSDFHWWWAGGAVRGTRARRLPSRGT